MSRKGFTLIELLVVVAVLALLASIVFSNLGGAREGARISNALSFQSQTHSLLGSDLVGWWNFNEGSGTTARDISGYGNNGTITGATYVDGVPGTGGTALEFDGVGDYVGIDHDEILDMGTGNFTIAAWVYNQDNGNEKYILGKMDGVRLGYGLSKVASDRFSATFRKTGTYSEAVLAVSTGTIPELNRWFYVVGTLDRKIGAKIYLNGVLDGTTNDTKLDGVNIINSSSLRIGALGAGYFFNGLVDDVRIYNRLLTAQEVQTLYAQTKDKYLAENE